MWDEAPFINEDEDEETLRNRFVELSALHPHQNHFTICAYIFKYLKDPFPRSQQAAMAWSNDLELQEKIRLWRQGGVKQEEALTKAQWEAEVLATTRDENLTSPEKKAKIEGYKLYAESQGWIVKAIDKTVRSDKAVLPQFIVAQYADA